MCRSRTVPSMLGTRDYEAGSEPLRAHDFAGSVAWTPSFVSVIIEWVRSTGRPIECADRARAKRFWSTDVLIAAGRRRP